MEDKKTTKATLSDLIPDDKNFNLHTEFGTSLLENSVRKFGLGRSILVNKNNRIIAGNGIVDSSKSIGLNNVRIIETVGDELIAVKRMDIDLDSAKGRELALADNATASVNLNWNDKVLEEVASEFDIDTDIWGVNTESALDDFEKKEDEFEKEIEEITDKNCELPIVPNFFENNECFVIVCNNTIDENFIRDLFDLNKNYVSQSGDGKERKTNVISVENLRKLIK